MKRKEAIPAQNVRAGLRRPVRSHIARTALTERQLKFILDATTDSHGIWKASTGPICINESLLSALGYTNADSVNRHAPIEEWMHPSDRPIFAAQVQACLDGSIPALQCELRLCTKPGVYKWFEIRGKATGSAKGKTGGIAFGVRSIEVAREQLRRALASVEQLTAMVEASQDCISVVDPVEFRLITFNEPFAEIIFKMFGVRVIPGMSPKDINPTTSEDWTALYRRVLVEGRAARDYYIPALKVTHHTLAQCLVREGRVFGIAVTGHDVTSQKEIEQALRKSEEKFSKVFHQAPTAVALTSTVDHRFMEINEAFTEATGYSPEDVVGKTPFDIGLWVDPEQRNKISQQLLLTGEIRDVDFLFRTKSGEIREALGSAALINIDGEPCMLGVNIDITDRRRAIEALRDSEERLRIAIQAGRMYAFEWNVATDEVQRSEQAAGVIGLLGPESRRTKREFIDHVHVEDRPDYESALHSLTPERPVYKVVFRLVGQNGRLIWLEESGKGIFGQDGTLQKVIGITSDVTESRESERALRDLSRRLITSQEEERRRVARELHDHIGQEAALICIQAQRLDSGVAEKEGTTHADVHELYRKINVLASDISKLSHRLHSSELAFLGLSAAAERLCRDFADQYKIDIDFQAERLPTTLDPAKALCFYRVLQECLQNVAKHSRASGVVVKVSTTEKELILLVTDNGTGFDLEKVEMNPGLGLLSMRERLNLIAGRLTITSAPAAGTTVTALCPYSSSPD